MDIRKKLKLYLKENLEQDNNNYRGAKFAARAVSYEEEMCLMPLGNNINNFIDNELDENKFQKLLFKHIDDRGLKDSDVYNKANIDRRLFSKIRSDENYHPSKETIIALASSLELSIKELEELLDSASYSLPKNNKFDLIIRFCFIEKIYDIFEINNLLHEYHCNLLTK